jgi:hypothetical protein
VKVEMVVRCAIYSTLWQPLYLASTRGFVILPFRDVNIYKAT